jgi:hypothetical protein
MAPDGKTERQFTKLHRLALDWVANIQQGQLTKNEMWVALQSTIWRTLSYCLPIISLSKSQWESICPPYFHMCYRTLAYVVTSPEILYLLRPPSLGWGYSTFTRFRKLHGLRKQYITLIEYHYGKPLQSIPLIVTYRDGHIHTNILGGLPIFFSTRGLFKPKNFP